MVAHFKTSRRSGAVALAIFLLMGFGPGAGASVDAENLERLAVEVAYRLDQELGEIDAAQRHLLIWRLCDDLNNRRNEPGMAPSDRMLDWQRLLESGEPALGEQLPAWFAPVGPGTVETLTLALSPRVQEASWALPRRSLLATAGARELTRGVPFPAADPARQLAWARDHAAQIWLDFLTLIAANPEWLPLVEPVIGSWTALPLSANLSEWQALEDQAALDLAQLGSGADDPLISLVQSRVASLLSSGPPDAAGHTVELSMAPYRLFLSSPQSEAMDRTLVALARSIEQLPHGRFTQYIEVLTGMAQVAILEPPATTSARLALVLDQLVLLDPVVLPQIEAVDPGLLTVYQQLRKMLRDQLGEPEQGPAEQLRYLASLTAAYTLDSRDLEGYLSQPVRDSIEKDLLVCFEISRTGGPLPQAPISAAQFERCLDAVVDWAVEQARQPELAGRAAGPYEAEALNRELGLSPWQRINYWIGFLGSQVSDDCGLEGDSVVNPFEWSVAARAYTWLADRWPAYFASADRSAQVDSMVAAGVDAATRLVRLESCGGGDSGPPLTYLMQRYLEGLSETAAALASATDAFRKGRLKPGADVDLASDAGQTTNYRPEDLVVRPCGSVASCDMSGPLEASRALVGLFPQPFLIADQIRMGDIRLCYDQVQWTDRRAVLPKVRNQAMANYFGRLGFDLRGYYGGQAEPVFSMRLTSQDEYEYLFGENSPEVLDNPCPRDLIGTQVFSELPHGRINLVPRRLTFMTADRMHPARVFETHWSEGNEWRDRFITGEGVEVLASRDGMPLTDAINTRLLDLYRLWNDDIYEQLLDTSSNGAASPLTQSLQRVNRDKQMVAGFAKLLFPRLLLSDAPIRASVFGRSGLFDRRMALNMQQNSVPVNQITPIAMSHHEDARLLFSLSSGRPEFAVGDSVLLDTLLQLAALGRSSDVGG